jgi:ferredoxin
MMRLREYRGQYVKFRPGDAVEDRVALIPNLEYRPEELNLYSEVDPLQENVPPLRGNNALRYVWTHHRREALTEILPAAPALAYMDTLQGRVDASMVSKHAGCRPDPVVLKKEIRECAASLGFSLCGVTLLDRRFVVEGSDAGFPYPRAVVLGMEMRKEWLLQAPNYRLRRYPDYDVYRRAGNADPRLANHIRRQGVSCFARVPFNGAAVYPVHAITAGLGELGAFGGVITPEFGPRQRWCMITVDSELPLDLPRDFGLAGFCENCLLCVSKCPAKAIPREPLWWRGVYKRKINDLKCWAFFTAWHTCAVCINACPLHRFGPREVLEHYERTGEVLGYDEIMAERPAYRKAKNAEKLLELVREDG